MQQQRPGAVSNVFGDNDSRKDSVISYTSANQSSKTTTMVQKGTFANQAPGQQKKQGAFYTTMRGGNQKGGASNFAPNATSGMMGAPPSMRVANN